MSTEIQIITIEPRGDIVKRASYAGNWHLPVTFVLDNGERITSSLAFRLKRDAVAKAGTLPAAPEHPMFACYDASGSYWGTSTKYSLLGSR